MWRSCFEGLKEESRLSADLLDIQLYMAEGLVVPQEQRRRPLQPLFLLEGALFYLLVIIHVI